MAVIPEVAPEVTHGDDGSDTLQVQRRSLARHTVAGVLDNLVALESTRTSQLERRQQMVACSQGDKKPAGMPGKPVKS